MYNVYPTLPRYGTDLVMTVDGTSNIWSYDLATGSTKQLTNFIADKILPTRGPRITPNSLVKEAANSRM